MKRITAMILPAAMTLCMLTAAAAPSNATGGKQSARQNLDAFNRKFVEACQKMDHAADAAFWADDGVDLLPDMEPMVGKAKIAAWLDGLSAQMAGAKMLYCTIDWRDIRIQGDMAYEWGINRQKVVFPPPQKPFIGEGKILLILKQQADGTWRVELESWNTNPAVEK
ncbi:MAG: YybH family protein [Candidatus Acidiferrales bacterium]